MSRFLNSLKSLSGFSGLFLLVASVGNLMLAYKAMQVGSRAVVTTNVVEMVSSPVSGVAATNSPSFVTPSMLLSPLGKTSSDSEVPANREVACYPYQYFLIGRRIGAQMHGRYYYDGSPCSYGRIDKIYPDRILLCSGDWISNKIVSEERISK